MAHLPRRLALIAIALTLTLAGGTLGFVLIEHYPVFDAFYMTVTTVTTVGYGEIHPLSQAGRIFNCFLILFGVITMLLAIGAMTQTVIELELNQFFGKRRIKSMIEKLQGHIILCGFGRVGRGAADELVQAGAKFVVVDRDEERVERAMKAGMLAVLADASHDRDSAGRRNRSRAGAHRDACLRRRQSIRDSDSESAQSETPLIGARSRGNVGAEDAPRGRRFCFRSL